MKKLVLILAAAAFMVSLPSCKKCSTCKYTIGGLTTTIPEVCGNKKDIDAYEASCKSVAAVGGVSCTCDKS